MKEQILVFCFLCFSVSLSAQLTGYDEKDDTLVTHALSEVVVTASRFSTLGINTPEAIRVLGSNPVQERQIRTSPEALMLTPGVFVQKTNHGGGSPFIRGLTGNQTLLLMDGVRISNSTMRYGPNQYLNTIDVFSTERMEILRGSGSVQYGSDALGGTIHAFSRELINTEEPVWGGKLLGRASTHNMEKSVRSELAYSDMKKAFRTGISWRKFGDIRGGDTTGRQTPTGYGEFDFDIKGKMLIAPQTDLTLLYQSVNQHDIPIYHKIVLEDYEINHTDPQKRKLLYLKLNQELNSGILKSLNLTASYQKTDEGRQIRKNGSDLLRNEYDKVRTLGFSAEAVASDDDLWSGNLGFEIYNDLVSSSRTDTDQLTGEVSDKRGLYPDGSGMNSLALFSVHSIDFQKWNITAGARYNLFVINITDQELGKVRLTPSALVGNLAILRKITTTSSLFVSVNTGFRTPNIDDLGTLGIVDFRYETPNFDLKPESSFQYQAGYKYLGAMLRGDFYIYRNHLYNLITRKRIGDQFIEGYPLYQKENSEKAFIQGVETAWDLKLDRCITLYGTFTYTYGQNVTKDEPARRIPPFFGRLAIDYRNKNFWFDLEWTGAGKQNRLAQGDKDDNRIPEGGTPGWNVINIHSGYSWNFFTLDLSLINLLNKDYRYHGSGINGYGRSLFVTLEVNLQK